MRILIAEDHVHLSHLFEDLLRPWGYDPVLVHDGTAALEALSGPDAPRLAVLDWRMPGLDGIEVCRRLRADPTRPYAYLVLLTGQGGRREMLEGLEAGADDFLTKPADEAELKARLACGRRLIALEQRLREVACRDPLTGLWNRGAILDRLDRELARSRREGRPLGVVLADLDHFKAVNDTHGHLAGDEVLRQAARRMLEAVRPYDTVGRYGGEEFLVVLPGCDADASAGLAERLRRRVAAEPMDCGLAVDVILSLGAAGTGGGPQAADAGSLMRAADRALYRAKGAGRDRVERSAAP